MVLLPGCVCCGNNCPCYRLCKYDWAVSFSDGFTRNIRANGCISSSDTWERLDNDPNDCTGDYTWYVPSSFGDGKWKSGGSTYFNELAVTGPVMNVLKQVRGTHSVAGLPAWADYVSGWIAAEATILCSHSSGSKASYSLRIGGRMAAGSERRTGQNANTVDAAKTWTKAFDFPRLTLPLESLCQTRDNADCSGDAREAMHFDLAENPVVVTFSAAGVFVNGQLKISPVTSGDEKSTNSAGNCYLRHIENFSITLTLKERAGCGTCAECVGACAYSIAITSPSQCAVQTSYLNCPNVSNGGATVTNLSVGWMLGPVSRVQLYPWSWFTSGGDVMSNGFKSGQARNHGFVGGQLFTASVYHEAYGANPGYSNPFFEDQIDPEQLFVAHITVRNDISISCFSGFGYGGFIRTTVACKVSSSYYSYNEIYAYSSVNNFLLPSQCLKNTSRRCSGEGSGASLMGILDAVPAISTGMSGATVTDGPLARKDGGQFFSPLHPGYGVAQSAVGSLKNASSASFAISYRESCNPLP